MDGGGVGMMKMFLMSLVKFFLWLHSFSYRVVGFLASQTEGGVHPKHRLMNYHRFFVDNINEGDVVLDVGCGNGALTYDIAGKAERVVGIDLNPKNIAFAKKRYARKNIEYMCGDATKDLALFKPFDAVTLSNVLEHIENRVEFLGGMKRKAPKLLIRVPMINRDWVTLYKKELEMRYYGDRGHFTEYTLDSFERELGEAGLKIEEYSIQFGEIWAVVGV